MFDLNRVFEDWLTTAVREALETRYGGQVTGQHRMHMDEEGQLPLVRPDITWWDGRHCMAVIDAKYKAPETAPARDDIYQMLAYCTHSTCGVVTWSTRQPDRHRSNTGF